VEPEPDDIEERVTALESQVSDLKRRVRASEQDAQAARVLAGAAGQQEIVRLIQGLIDDRDADGR
jgi:hypothetical protein